MHYTLGLATTPENAFWTLGVMLVELWSSFICSAGNHLGCLELSRPHSWHIGMLSWMLRWGVIRSPKWSCKWDSFWLFSVLRKSFSTPSEKFAPGSRSILPNSASRWKTFWWLLTFARNPESFDDGISRGRMSDSFNCEHQQDLGNFVKETKGLGQKGQDLQKTVFIQMLDVAFEH